MTYPRNPPGLRWDEHYTMANMVYYAFVSVRETSYAANVPLTLTRAQPERTYGSQYVGVTVWKGRRYLGNWTVDGRSKRGTMRPMTPEGERWAAQDRARALGLDYIEMRDGTLVPYPQYAPEEV